MADWHGRGKGRTAKHQGNVPGVGGAGAGGGRSGSQPTIETPSSWVGAGGGRAGSQPTVTSKGGSGAGGGRAGAQPTVKAGSKLGSRSASATVAMTNNSGGKVDDVADPEGNYVFALEIKGIEVAQFLECSGLKSSTQVFELEEGGMNHRVHKLPGQSRWDNITLRYGVSSDVSLLTWRNKILNEEFGEDSRENGSIVVKNNQMEVVRRYNFVAAWPVAWEGPSLSASGSELAIEMVELAHHGISIS